MIITISGDAGAGKTTVGRLLAKRLGYRFFSAGELFRRIAKKRGVRLEQLTKPGRTADIIDTNVDRIARQVFSAHKNLVVDTRALWVLAKQAFRVFLSVDEKTAALRIWKDHLAGKRRAEKPLKNFEDALREIRARRKNDVARSLQRYKVNYLDKRHYALVIDTTKTTPKHIVRKIFAAVNKIA